MNKLKTKNENEKKILYELKGKRERTRLKIKSDGNYKDQLNDILRQIRNVSERVRRNKKSKVVRTRLF